MTQMTRDEHKAILAISLYAAFADGIKEESEREEVRRIAAALADQAETLDMGRVLAMVRGQPGATT